MRLTFVSMTFFVALALGAGCSADPAHCRFDPYCGGGIGGFCGDAHDCDEGHCCDHDRCNAGMCTYSCREDRDCPEDMRCSHDVCFFACERDEDCASGFTCRHGNTVCEWG
jgi:hypothetical protein